VVIGLKGGAALSFGEDDEGVEDLIELGEIEPPSPPGKSLVPHPAYVRGVRKTVGTQANIAVLVDPLIRVRVIRVGIPKPARSMNLAESIDCSDKCVGLAVVREGPLQSAEHGVTCDGGVDGQEDVVGKHK
jgi:hypothetical protein